MQRTWKTRAAAGVGTLAVAYLVAAIVVQALAGAPPVETAPRVGERLVSRAELVEQTVLREEGAYLVTELVLLPGSPGPPLHFHESFDEAFTVVEGTLSVEEDGGVKTLRAGDAGRFVAGNFHRPFNASNERVVLHGSIPKVFATCLAQFYAFMDKEPENKEGIAPLLQLSLMRKYCDTHVAPAPVEALLFGALGPMARASGLRSHY